MGRRLHTLALVALLLCLCVSHLQLLVVVSAQDGDAPAATASSGQQSSASSAASGEASGEAVEASEDVDAADSGEASGSTSDAAAEGDENDDTFSSSLKGEFKSLYQTLLTATKAGKPWNEAAITSFSAPDVSQVLSQLILQFTSAPGVTTFLKQYKSLGLGLPQQLDLAGLIQKNPATSSDWEKTINETSKALQDKNDYSTSLWNAVVAYSHIAAIDGSVSKAEDMNETTRATYTGHVQTYFLESATLSWINTALPVIQQLNLTQIAGKYADPAWLLELIEEPSADAPPSLEDASLFVELALLKHVSAEKIAASASSWEIGGGLATRYITGGRNLLTSGNVVALNVLLLDRALAQYSSIAQTFCTPQHALRFCLIKAFADQGAMFAWLDRGLYNANAVTKLPLSAAKMDRQKYLTTLNKKVQKQVLSFAITQAFDDLQKSVQVATSDLTARTQAATYENTVKQQEAIKLKMDEAANNFLEMASGDVEANQAQLLLKTEKIASLMKEVDEMSEEYVTRVKEIAEQALKQAESERTSGIFGFIMKVLSLFNPVNWVTNPGLFTDVLRSGNKLRKSVEAVDNAKGLIDIIQNSLVPQFLKLLDNLKSMEPKLKEIADAAKPIVEAKPDAKDRTLLNEMASTFLRAFASYENPVMMTDIDILEELFTNIQTEMCSMAKKRAQKQCVQVKEDVKVFDKLAQVFSLSGEALDVTVEIARAAVSQQSANVFKNAVSTAHEEATKALNALQDEWDKEAKDAQAKWAKYQRRLEYQQAVLSLNLLATSVRSSSATLMACNFLTYLNGGVAIPDCIPMYQNPANVQDLKKIIAFRFTTQPEPFETIAYIPTMPSTSSDTNYIDLERMMSQNVNVTFQVPQDTEWLRKYNWVPPNFDVKNTVVFLQKIQIILPPKMIFTDQKTKQIVSITAKATLSDLGPAVNNKKYEIPMRQYAFSYEESKQASESCATSKTFAYPYHKCDKQLLKACPISEGLVDANGKDVPLPSLYSPLTISTQFESSGGGGGGGSYQLSHKGVRGSAPIAVGVTLLLHKLGKDQIRPMRMKQVVAPVKKEEGEEVTEEGEEGEEEVAEEEEDAGGDGGEGEGEDDPAEDEEEEPARWRHRSRRRHLRRSFATAASTAGERCCAVGSYLKDWKSDECDKCPAGLVSQLGGLYCMRPPSAGEGEGEEEADPDADAEGEGEDASSSTQDAEEEERRRLHRQWLL